MSRWLLGGALLLAVGACVFAPDFSRYPACDDQGGCPSGFTCLAPEGLCLPDCGALGPCPLEEPPAPDSGQPGADAGSDAGTDAGAGEEIPPLVLGAEQPPDGVTEEGFSFTFQVQGGAPPYHFTTADALPAGLTLDGARGILSGTPSGDGDVSFILEVRDEGTPEPRRVSQAISVRIHPVLRVAGPLILADVPSGRAYTERIPALGGRPPYTFELSAGNALPTGLALYEDGSVRGTSNASGAASSFEVRVTDSARPPRSATRNLQITPSTCVPATLCIRTRSLPDARQGEAYSYALQANTNTLAPSWKLEKGPLPPGLQLSPEGVLSGAPTQAGSFQFTVCITEWLGTVFGTRSLSLTLKVH